LQAAVKNHQRCCSSLVSTCQLFTTPAAVFQLEESCGSGKLGVSSTSAPSSLCGGLRASAGDASR